MKAVVLAAGLGTRLGELTAERSKPALLVGGHALIAHVVAHLDECGFEEVAVNLSYRPDQVRAALADARPAIRWFEESELLGTAGALSPMHDFLSGEEAFLVHYGDVLTDHDLGAMLTRHRERDALLTMLIHERPGSNSVVAVDETGRVVAFLERPTDDERRGVASSWVNSGIYVCSAAVLELLPRAPSDFARDLVPRAMAAGAVFAEPLAGFRCAVDSPDRLGEAEAAFQTGRWRSPLASR